MDKKEFAKDLGLRIKIIRLEAHLSQEEIAESATFSLLFVSDVECGKKGISLYYFLKLAKVLKIDMNDFLERYVDLE